MIKVKVSASGKINVACPYQRHFVGIGPATYLGDTNPDTIYYCGLFEFI